MLTDYVEARKFYDYNEHSRVGAKHGEFVTDEICDRFCVLGTAEQATTKLRELESIGVDQFNIYLMTPGRKKRSRRTGATSCRSSRGRRVEAQEELRQRWDAAAVGWEAERETVTAFGAPVTEALVAALDAAARRHRPRSRRRHRRHRRGARRHASHA